MELQPGAVAVYRRTFTQEDFDRFAALSGDDNPIHVDPAFAARTRFGRTVCHGMLLYSTLCAALTREIGPGYVQHEQELMFVTATYAGEEVEVRLQIMNLSPAGGSAALSTVITRPDGSVACQGSAKIALPGAWAGPIQNEGAAAAVAAPGKGTIRHKGLSLGQVAQVTRVFSKADLAEYSALTGDTNPAHGGGEGALGPAQVPPGLLGGLYSFILGTRLPGRGTNWLKQRLTFPEPAPVGELVRACVEVMRLRPDKDLVNLSTVCTLADGRVVCSGEALVLVKDLQSAAAV